MKATDDRSRWGVKVHEVIFGDTDLVAVYSELHWFSPGVNGLQVGHCPVLVVAHIFAQLARSCVDREQKLKICVVTDFINRRIVRRNDEVPQFRGCAYNSWGRSNCCICIVVCISRRSR